ncbi:tetratricopeptide repeat protein [Capnocytophaga leadbetteri]|uniref:tetratricopeptide repeat protein n=1 Tax=Capnocytophaga leadbetteri TaxID=327575 RepID=UPI0028F14F22|nr:tetratricopeptide repeat protein [Capnocytophaga leadbetteri]
MMIKKIILLLIPLFSNLIIGQETESYNIELKQGEKFERILSPQQVYINSATKLGGKTRVYFTVNLPKNTVRWFYVVTTTKGEGEGQSLNILAQLTAATLTGGMSTLATAGSKMITMPSGSGGVIDSYLLDRTNLDVFTNKGDNWGQSLYYNMEGTRTNYKSGLVMINTPNSFYTFIGIKNPSASVGVNVNIEAIAIVKEIDWNTLYNDGKKLKESLRDLIQVVLKKHPKDFADKVADCTLEKIMNEKSASEVIKSYTTYAFSEYVISKIENCRTELNPNKSTIETKKSDTYNNLGESYFEKKQNEKALENYKKALELNPKNGEAKANIAFLYLIDNKVDLAIDLYIEAISMFKDDPINGKNSLIKAYNKTVYYLSDNFNKVKLVLNKQTEDFISIQDMLKKELDNMK